MGSDPLDRTLSTKLPKVKSTGHDGSSGIVVPDKLPGQKGVTKKMEKKNMFFGHFDFRHLFKITPP